MSISLLMISIRRNGRDKNIKNVLSAEHSCTVSHKSHDPCFHKKYGESEVAALVTQLRFVNVEPEIVLQRLNGCLPISSDCITRNIKHLLQRFRQRVDQTRQQSRKWTKLVEKRDIIDPLYRRMLVRMKRSIYPTKSVY